MINGGAITINGEQVKDLEFVINKDVVLKIVKNIENIQFRVNFRSNFDEKRP